MQKIARSASSPKNGIYTTQVYTPFSTANGETVCLNVGCVLKRLDYISSVNDRVAFEVVQLAHYHPRVYVKVQPGDVLFISERGLAQLMYHPSGLTPVPA